MGMKDSPLNKLIYGDGNEVRLPTTRRQAFAFYGKEHFGKLILTSLLCFAFFIPAIVWLYVMNYAKSEALRALDSASATYLQEYSSLMVAHALKTYLILIPFVVVGFIGLAGAFSFVKKMIFNERSNYAVFFKGIPDRNNTNQGNEPRSVGPVTAGTRRMRSPLRALAKAAMPRTAAF